MAPHQQSRPDSTKGGWQWAVAFAVLFAVVAALLMADRRSAGTAQLHTPTTIGPRDSSTATDPVVTETQLSLPSGIAGTLYLLAEDATLTEIDLPTGRSRSTRLTFRVEPGASTQVVALQNVVLIGTRRQVFSVDRATLSQQQRLAEERWILGAADGTWAALVPFGAAAAEITMLNGSGVADRGRTVRLPAGVTAVGTVSAGLIVDAAGTLYLRPRDGRPGPTLGTGRYVGSGATAMARLVCQPRSCALHLGTTAQPDQKILEGINPAGPWEFGPGAVFRPRGDVLAMVTDASVETPGATRARVIRLDTTNPSLQSSPIATGEATGAAGLAFSADGATLIHTSARGVGFWPIGPADTATGAAGVPNAAQEVALPAAILALAVTAHPTPPPPPRAGPPPSFA